MKVTPEVKCMKGGDLVYPFSDLAERKDRHTITTDDVMVKGAGQICLSGCPAFNDCLGDIEKLKHGEDTLLWPEPTEEELPCVMAGRLVTVSKNTFVVIPIGVPVANNPVVLEPKPKSETKKPKKQDLLTKTIAYIDGGDNLTEEEWSTLEGAHEIRQAIADLKDTVQAGISCARYNLVAATIGLPQSMINARARRPHYFSTP